MKTTRLFLLCGILIILKINSASAQWTQTGGPLGGYVQCIEKVGNHIWAGTNIGIYESQNEGFSWQKLPQFNKSFMDIMNYHDTIVMITVEYDTVQTDFLNFFSHTSFNNGATWQTPVLIESSWMYGNFGTCHLKSGILFSGFDSHYVSHDFGVTWTVLPQIGGQPIDYFYNGQSTIAASTWDAMHTYYSYYFSGDETQSWQHLATLSPLSCIFLKDSLIIIAAQYYDTLSHSYIIRKETPFAVWDTVLVAPYGHTIYQLSEFEGTLYARTDSVYWASTDEGLTWLTIAKPDIVGLSDTITFADGNYIEAWAPEGIRRHDILQDTIYPTNTGMKNELITALRAYGGRLYTITGMDFLVSEDAGQVWQKLDYPASENYPMIVDFLVEGDTLIAITPEHLIRSFDAGTSWDSLPLPRFCWPGMYPEPGLARRGNELLLNTDSVIYVSDDLGLTWDSLPPIQLFANPGPNWCTDNYSSSGKITVYNNTIFAATPDGFLFKYNDVAGTWAYSTCSWMNIKLYVLDTVLVTVGGDDFQRSYDNGDTWTMITPTGLPLDDLGEVIMPFTFIDINGIWFGSCYNEAVYLSADQGLTWQPTSIGAPPFRPMGDLASLNGVLYSGSNYKSVWKRSGVFNQVTGTVYLDENCNGIQDINEDGIANMLVELQPYGSFSSTDTAGYFIIYTDAIRDTLRPVLPGSFTSSDPEFLITNGPSTNNNFGICVTPGVQDLSIDLTNVSVFRPGFETNLLIEVQNKGSMPMIPAVTLISNPNFIISSSVPVPDVINGDTLQWTLPSLPDFMDVFTINLTGTTSLAATLGDSLHFWSQVGPLANDNNIADNTSELHDVVVGSFDPNDKTCLNGDQFTTQQIATSDEMEFIVRFQNTGTFPASFIHVIDTLSGYLDPSTFRVISSSHAMQWSMTGHGILDFFFDAINLPPSITDEPGSHGYVKYAVQCKESVSLGNAVTNTAYIFFDYNPAIVTNTTTTAISCPVIMTNPPLAPWTSSENPVVVYPNPAANQVTIAWKDRMDLTLSLVSISGQVVYSSKMSSSNAATIDISGIPGGIYVVKLISKDFVETRKLIIQ